MSVQIHSRRTPKTIADNMQILTVPVTVESRDGSGYENAKRQYLADSDTHHHFLSPRFATSSGVGCDLAWEPYA
ncbi:hypothetical protein BDZ97DRAFT_1915131 [Flammula alnicola]|nr:hypothetical protein BDZ97DRAFT_1915131 [Flammula alnicola]